MRPDELVEVGLASPRQGGRGGVYDKFRARVLFPIRDQNGHAVGLGGRLLEGDGPKYLNSPATPLFDKSRTLYLIDKAKGPIRKSGQAVIVEGYTDALMAHQAGFDNVVASLGTALTPGQVALLTRYASRIVLAYDVDAAGEKAGGAGMTALVGLIGELQRDTSGVKLEDVRVARLPDGKDPDEVVREAPAAWEAAIATAKPLARIPDRPPHGPVRPQDELRPDRLRRSRHAGDPRGHRSASSRRGHRPGSHGVGRRGSRPAPGPRAAGAQSDQPGRDRPGSPPTPVLSSPDALPIHDILRAITPVELELLRLLLLVPDQQLRVVDELGPDQLPSTVARELFRAIVLQRAPDDQGVHPPFDSAALLLALDDETAALARALYAKPGPGARELDPARLDYEVSRLLIELEDDSLRERSDYNEAAQGEAERAGDREAIGRLMLERRQINEMRLSLDRRRDQTRLLASHRR